MVTIAGHGHRSGSAYWVWTSAAPLRRSSRGSDHARRSPWFRRAERQRLDAGGDELGVTRGGRDAQAGALRERRQLAQEVQDVRLVARPLPPEHVRVDDDEWGAHAHARS